MTMWGKTPAELDALAEESRRMRAMTASELSAAHGDRLRPDDHGLAHALSSRITERIRRAEERKRKRQREIRRAWLWGFAIAIGLVVIVATTVLA